MDNSKFTLTLTTAVDRLSDEMSLKGLFHQHQRSEEHTSELQSQR